MYKTTQDNNLSLSKPVKVIAVSAGKGGVGKSNIAINLSIALAKTGKKILLMDADLGLANIDILLGLESRYNLSHVISGIHSLADIMLLGPEGIKIIPSATGTDFMTQLSPAQHAGIINAFNELTDDFDYMIIDTCAGISDSVLSFIRSSQEVILVACDEPASITDAYALIKILSKRFSWNRFHLLANMVRNLKEGEDVFKRLYQASEQFLDIQLEYLGAIPFDESVHEAVKKQQAVLIAYPNSKASKAFHKIAAKVASWPCIGAPGGNTSFFLERLLLPSKKGASSGCHSRL
jgi:flagellar biosynthesis protein FlhG